MRIEIQNHQSLHSLKEDAVTRYATWVMDRVSALEPSFLWTELSLVFMDDRIRALNRQWFDRDRVTDVISFAYPEDHLGGGDTGEVILNVKRAFDQGGKRSTPDEEFALYLAHGCHHLMGADDDTPEHKHHMLSLETSWVREAREQGLCGPFYV